MIREGGGGGGMSCVSFFCLLYNVSFDYGMHGLSHKTAMATFYSSITKGIGIAREHHVGGRGETVCHVLR